MCRKLKYLNDIAEEINAACIMINESHLTGNHFDEEIIRFLDNFQIFRGTAIFVKKTIQASQILSFSNSTVDFNAVECKKENMVLVSFYRPPNSTHDQFSEAVQALDEGLELTGAGNKNLILYGDFNLGSIEWNETSPRVPSPIEFFNDFLNKWCLLQRVKFPTRQESMLDLVFTNDDNLIDNLEPRNHVTELKP